MIWLTGATSPAIEAALAHRDDFGLMTQPRSYGGDVLDRWPRFAVDCGGFARKFTPQLWLRYLQEVVAPRAERCMFVCAPDVYGDKTATDVLWTRYSPAVASLRVPVAYIAQPGTTALDVPDAAGVVFMGGPDEWRLSEDAWELVRWVRATGRPVHVGAVNSATRLTYAHMRGATSADGTFIGFGPDKNLPQVLRWFDQVNRPRLDLWGVGT